MKRDILRKTGDSDTRELVDALDVVDAKMLRLRDLARKWDQRYNGNVLRTPAIVDAWEIIKELAV